MAGRLARLLFSTYRQLTNPLQWPMIPREVSGYLRDLHAFRADHEDRLPGVPIDLEPIFFQRSLNSPFDAHYTYQAAWATRRILGNHPREHTDVSSQVPFVAQLAAVIPVTMYEFHRPDIDLPGLTLREASVLSLPMPDRSVTSLSCLHVIEHVGLGRYGDPLDPEGTQKALKELVRVVCDGGSLFISLPVGRERVAFNAHRVCDANRIVRQAEAQGLRLRGFALVDDGGRFHDPAEPGDAAGLHYGCGMFWFVRADDASPPLGAA